MQCILCQVFKSGGPKSCQCNTGMVASSLAGMPPPVLRSYQAPGNRNPPLTDAGYMQRPGTIASALHNPASDLRGSSPVMPTDQVNPFPRSAAEQRVRWVKEQWTIVGGPACTAPNQPGWGWIHNYGYMTIADTMKPPQKLPSYNTAAIDTELLIDRARSSILRAMYGGKK